MKQNFIKVPKKQAQFKKYLIFKKNFKKLKLRILSAIDNAKILWIHLHLVSKMSTIALKLITLLIEPKLINIILYKINQ